MYVYIYIFFFDKETVNLREINRAKKLRFGYLISKKFKQCLGVNSKLVKR